MIELFPIYEVGSLPKLAARVQAIGRSPIKDDSMEELNAFAKKTGLHDSSGFEQIVESLERNRMEGHQLSSEEIAAVIDFNALLNIKLQEQSGIEFVYDGEARRIEMYRNVARQIQGFEDLPEMIRSRGPDSWRASVCVDEPKLKTSLDNLPIVREFKYAQSNATHALKVPIDDPYMISVMTDNRHYTQQLMEEYANQPRKLRYQAKRALNLALAENIIKPQVQAVVDAGANWVQLDIPAATIDIEHIPIMVEGINAVVNGIEGVKFSLHFCYPRRLSLTEKTGYKLLFPHVLDLDPKVDHFSLEVASADQYEQDLAPFVKCQTQRRFEIGLGVVDITLERQKAGLIETPELVRLRLVNAAEQLRDPKLIYAAPDCGLRQLSLERSVRLYDTMVEGTNLARKG